MNDFLTARSFDELHALLPGIDVTVPERGQGREKEHTEQYAIVRLLGSLPMNDGDLPLRLSKRERPDFLLCLGGSPERPARKIGIEHTEAIPGNIAHEMARRSGGLGPDVYFTRQVSVSEPRRTRQDIEAEIKSDKPGRPWYGDEVEVSWSNAIRHFIDKKVEKTVGYERFDENWLLIYDNWPAPAKDRHKGLEMLRRLLDTSNPWARFDSVFILDESVLLELSKTASLFHAVNRRR